MSLYLKYRPLSFDHLVGQDHISKTLLNALKKDAISHAYIFCGPRGTGKTSTARLIAKSLNCEKPNKNNQPCNKCDICKDSNTGKLIDLIEIDAASNRGIDEIRDLKEKIKFSPSRAKKKVYIIDEVHMLTKEAFNALLKTLEEPPSHAHFILATTEIHKVPETIISRCQRFDFKRITTDHISKRLKYIAESEKIVAEEESLNILANIANGGLRDAIGLLEQLSGDNKLTADFVNNALGLTDNTACINLYHHISKAEILKALEIIDNIYNSGADLYEFSKSFIQYLRNQLHEKIKKNENHQLVITLIENFTAASQNLKTALIPQLPLEIAIIKTINPSETPNISADINDKKKPLENITSNKTSSVNSTTKSDKKNPINQSDKIKKEQIKTEQKNPIENQDRNQRSIKSTSLTISEIKNNWNRVIASIKGPAIKMSLKEGYPHLLDKNILTVHFGSKFHLEKLSKSETIAVIENAIQQIYEQKIVFKPELGEIKLSSTKAASAKTVTTKESSTNNDLAEQAMDIFGGTIL